LKNDILKAILYSTVTASGPAF